MAAHSRSIHAFPTPRHGGPDSDRRTAPRQPHHSPHPKPHPPEKHVGWMWLAGSAALLVGVLLTWGIIMATGRNPTVVDLVDQMVASAEGRIGPTHHVLGGRLYAKRDGDQVTVVASGLPQKDCVQAGWVLMRRGIITINGVTPQRVSAAVLADLCAKGEDSSKLEWVPKPAD